MGDVLIIQPFLCKNVAQRGGRLRSGGAAGFLHFGHELVDGALAHGLGKGAQAVSVFGRFGPLFVHFLFHAFFQPQGEVAALAGFQLDGVQQGKPAFPGFGQLFDHLAAEALLGKKAEQKLEIEDRADGQSFLGIAVHKNSFWSEVGGPGSSGRPECPNVPRDRPSVKYPGRLRAALSGHKILYLQGCSGYDGILRSAREAAASERFA